MPGIDIPSLFTVGAFGCYTSHTSPETSELIQGSVARGRQVLKTYIQR